MNEPVDATTDSTTRDGRREALQAAEQQEDGESQQPAPDRDQRRLAEALGRRVDIERFAERRGRRELLARPHEPKRFTAGTGNVVSTSVRMRSYSSRASSMTKATGPATCEDSAVTFGHPLDVTGTSDRSTAAAQFVGALVSRGNAIEVHQGSTGLSS